MENIIEFQNVSKSFGDLKVLNKWSPNNPGNIFISKERCKEMDKLLLSNNISLKNKRILDS